MSIDEIKNQIQKKRLVTSSDIKFNEKKKVK